MKRGILLLLLFALIIAGTIVGCKNDPVQEKLTTKEIISQEIGEERAEEIIGDVTVASYRTITECYDWGPAISKVVLDLGQPIDSSSLSEDTFTAISVRTINGFDNQSPRAVMDAYVSDESGNEDPTGAFITLEMAVGPNLNEGSPFNYDFSTGFNQYVETSYRIALDEGTTLKGVDGTKIQMLETTKEGKTGNVNLIADDFDNNIPFTFNDINLLYASYQPESASKEEGSNPLIIWLHGAGEGGKDTTIALMGNKVVNLATDSIQSLFGEAGAYILVPQSPTMWMDINGAGVYNNQVEGSDGKSYYTEALMALIDDYVTSHPEIDKNRIYIGGCSNGGYMTVNMIMTYPEYFAAAYPVCEAYYAKWLTDEKIEAIKEIPIWFTHALTDTTVPVDSFTNELYNRLVAAGATNVHYSLFDKVEDTSGLYFKKDGMTPYEYMGHFSWIYTLNNECVETIDGQEVSLFDWLAAQSK